LAQGRIHLIEPFITRFHGGEGSERRNHAIDDPLPTLDTSNRYSLVEPLLVEYHGTSTPYPVSIPVKTITTKDRFALLEPFITKVNHSGGDRVSPIKEPLGTLTTKRDNAIITAYGLDIRFRMLKNHELKKAQGFPDDYVITGNTTEQTKQIGNAVPVNTAKALALAAMGA
jgi:DNA (cytosine-5)-methyltransferase 1